MSGHDAELKKELDATLHARRELGPEYEDELVESFLEKLDAAVDRRVRRQLAEQQMVVARGGRTPHGRPGTGTGGRSPELPEGWGPRLGLAVASLVLAVPLSAIAVVNAHLPGLLICWAGIAAVNVAQAGRTWFSPAGAGARRGTGRGETGGL
jgi:hypothetical protein